jgi:hypothetical protein
VRPAAMQFGLIVGRVPLLCLIFSLSSDGLDRSTGQMSALHLDRDAATVERSDRCGALAVIPVNGSEWPQWVELCRSVGRRWTVGLSGQQTFPAVSPRSGATCHLGTARLLLLAWNAIPARQAFHANDPHQDPAED